MLINGESFFGTIKDLWEKLCNLPSQFADMLQDVEEPKEELAQDELDAEEFAKLPKWKQALIKKEKLNILEQATKNKKLKQKASLENAKKKNDQAFAEHISSQKKNTEREI